MEGYIRQRRGTRILLDETANPSGLRLTEAVKEIHNQIQLEKE